MSVQFKSPICPPIAAFQKKTQYAPYRPATGPLTSESLFAATLSYYQDKSPLIWLESLGLLGSRPSSIAPRLWGEAQWLLARLYFDKRKMKESSALFDLMVEEFKGKALFHQHRTWVHFFNGKFDRALGDIVSAESPLIYPVPFYEKFFIRALIERETCQYEAAINTVAKGRATLSYAKPRPDRHPWVNLCYESGEQKTCQKLESYFIAKHEQEITKGLNDLDLLEIELRDKTSTKSAPKATADIIWPFVGENWKDELGYYAVAAASQCGK